MGDTVTLGRIEFVGDELVVTVNSAERFEAARKWLEKLPGVVFKSVRTRRWDEAEKDRPLDERIAKPEPVEMTPEMAAAVQEMMNKHYMGWIDEPLPILGGKTPRQACRTEAGRQQVTMLIRTMPDPDGIGLDSGSPRGDAARTGLGHGEPRVAAGRSPSAPCPHTDRRCSCETQSVPQRTLPLRQREEVQEVLRPRIVRETEASRCRRDCIPSLCAMRTRIVARRPSNRPNTNGCTCSGPSIL